jgi:hypothetical protein
MRFSASWTGVPNTGHVALLIRRTQGSRLMACTGFVGSRYDATVPRPIHPLPESFYVATAIVLLLADIVALHRAASCITMITLFGVVTGVSLWGRTGGLPIAKAFFVSVVISTAWLFPLLLAFEL